MTAAFGAHDRWRDYGLDQPGHERRLQRLDEPEASTLRHEYFAQADRSGGGR